MFGLMRLPTLAQMNLIWFLAMFAFVTAESVFALFMTDDYGFNTAQVGLMFALAGFVIICVQGRLIGPLTRKLGEWNIAALGPFVFAGAMVLFALATHTPVIWLLIVAVIFNAFGRSLQTPSLSALLSHVGPGDQQGAVFGLFQAFGSLARVLGPAVSGFLYDHKHGYPYIMACVLTLIAGTWTLLLRRKVAAAKHVAA
jgi:MFS family permease